jgi:hypothetical protein
MIPGRRRGVSNGKLIRTFPSFITSSLRDLPSSKLHIQTHFVYAQVINLLLQNSEKNTHTTHTYTYFWSLRLSLPPILLNSWPDITLKSTHRAHGKNTCHLALTEDLGTTLLILLRVISLINIQPETPERPQPNQIGVSSETKYARPRVRVFFFFYFSTYHRFKVFVSTTSNKKRVSIHTKCF